MADHLSDSKRQPKVAALLLSDKVLRQVSNDSAIGTSRQASSQGESMDYSLDEEMNAVSPTGTLSKDHSNTIPADQYPEPFISDEDLSGEQIEALEYAQWLVENPTFTDAQLEFVKGKVKALPLKTHVDQDIRCQLDAMCARALLIQNPPDIEALFGLVD